MAIKKVINIEVNSDDAVKDVNKLGESIEGVGEKGEKANKEINDSSKGAVKGLGGVAKGFKGVGLAIKAAGIGIVIGLFVALKDIVGKNQKIIDSFSSVMTTIGLVFNEVTDAIGEAFTSVSKLTGAFDATKKVVLGLVNIAFAPLKIAFLTIKSGVLGLQLAWENSFLGKGRPKKILELQTALVEVAEDLKEVGKGVIDSGKDIVNNFTEAVAEVGSLGEAVITNIKKVNVSNLKEQADAVVALKNQALLAAAINRGLIEDFDRQAELQRQIRDDVSKSMEDRIAANTKLGDILEDQRLKMLANANLVIQAAKNELLLNDNIENQVSLIEALNEKKAIEAQITGFQSEQLINKIGLINEVAAVDKEAADNIIANAKKVKDIKEKAAKEEKKTEEALAATKLAVLNKSAAAVIEIIGRESALGKAVAVAQAIWNTKNAITKTLASTPFPFNIPAAIATGLFGLAQVKGILSTPNPVGGGVGGSAPSASSITAPVQAAAPQFNVVGTSDTNQLATSVANQTQQPVQAFVVSTEISSQQSLDRQKESTASFG
tara:strand:- start:2005 stop:3654 length:1650 start_codon:yes stop_codon:yes gene_type:complete